VPTKCFWYLIDFQMKNEKWQFVRNTQQPGEITIKDDLQCQVAIPWLEAHKACLMFGVQLAPNRNGETEVNYILSVMADWKVRMAASKLNHTDAMFSLKMLFCTNLHTTYNYNILPPAMPPNHESTSPTRPAKSGCDPNISKSISPLSTPIWQAQHPQPSKLLCMCTQSYDSAQHGKTPPVLITCNSGSNAIGNGVKNYFNIPCV